MVRDKQFYRTIFKIALPSAFQSLISFLVVIADDIMVSSLNNGVSAQAAVSQVNSITAFYTSALLGFVSGSTVLISQYWGKKDTDSIKRIFSIIIWFCFGISILAVCAAKLFPTNILSLVINPSETEVTSYAIKYFSIVCLSYIPYALSYSLIGMLRAVEVVRITLYITVMSLFVNIGLNYLLIFGHFGFPEMGVAGAAAATLITRLIEFVMVWIFTYKIQKRLDIKIKDLLRIDRSLVRDYIKYGLPVGIADTQWALITMLKTAIVGQLGAMFMAANNIASSMMNLGTMFCFSLAGGACIVIGKAVGEGDYKKTREYSKTIQIMFFFIGLIMAGIVFLIRIPFTNLYGSARSSPEVFEYAAVMIAIGAVTLIGTNYHASCFFGINRGAGDGAFVLKVDIICGWFIVLPLTALAALVFEVPLPIVFLCTRIDQCFKWIIALLRLRGNKWIKNVTR